jgi:hypothetical protein
VVGGVASAFGSVVGAAILTMLPQVLSTFEGGETVVFGAIPDGDDDLPGHIRFEETTVMPLVKAPHLAM